MIENLSIFLGIITAELMSLFILYLFGCKMKGKYWNTLLFILGFIFLFSIACILYLSFNPIDNDTYKQSQATDLIYIFSGVSTFLAPLVILFTLSDWKYERQFDKKMVIYEEILNDCEKLNSVYEIKSYFTAELLKNNVNKNLIIFENNYLIKTNVFDSGSLINIIENFDYSYINHENSIYIFEIYRNLLNKITILQAIRSHKELSTNINSLLLLINSKKVQYAEFINFFNKFNYKEISYMDFKSQILSQPIFNEQDNIHNQKKILVDIQKVRENVYKEIKKMMD
jgi:hypothetical protein